MPVSVSLPASSTYTVHGVLAGAYRGRDVGTRALLSHASTDGGETALCKKARHLADAEPSGEVDCDACLARIAKRGLVRAPAE